MEGWAGRRGSCDARVDAVDHVCTQLPSPREISRLTICYLNDTASKRRKNTRPSVHTFRLEPRQFNIDDEAGSMFCPWVEVEVGRIQE